VQNLSFVGKVYNLKEEGKKDSKRVNFRLAVRKKYVSDEDKKNSRYNVFVPFVAFGKTAELIAEHFEDGSILGVSNCEYSTFEYEKDGDKVYGHNFKVGELNFLPREEDDAGAKKSKKTKSKSRRRDDDDDEDEDEEEEERPRKKKKKSKPAKKKKPVYDEDEDDDDEDDDDIDDDDVPF
jgi:single-stranded DNA-binding protein